MHRRYWIAVSVLALAVVAAGSALAATKLESSGAHSQAVIKDAAGRLHVAPGALSSALKKALADQIDAAVAAGRLTKAQGEAMKARIAAEPLRLGGFGSIHWGARRAFGLGRGVVRPGFGFRHERPGLVAPGMLGAGLRAVTPYLGITPAQLRADLADGKSLARIAKAHGKTAAGLVAALVATAKSRLDRAVVRKHLTAAQEKAMLSRLHGFFGMLVNHRLPGPMPWLRFRPGLLQPYPVPLRGSCTASSSCDTS